jgi:hypothetical protein
MRNYNWLLHRVYSVTSRLRSVGGKFIIVFMTVFIIVFMIVFIIVFMIVFMIGGGHGHAIRFVTPVRSVL